MLGYDVWDTVSVPFPYTDRPARQRRPALLLARPPTPGPPSLVWVLMITSAANRAWVGDVAISDTATAGLPVASLIRTAKIATIDAQDMHRIGSLSQPDRARVTAALRASLAQALAG